MNEQAMRAFLDQFAASRRDFDDWPQWMRDSAKVVGATFPKAHSTQHTTEVASPPLEGQTESKK